MVNRPMFVDAIKSRIGKTVDTSELEKQLEYADERMRRAQSVKRRLEQQMDGLEDADPFFEEKLQDLQRRYDEQYGLIGEIEEEKESIWDQIHTIRQEQLTEENIYRLLITFDKVYFSCNEAEQKELMRTIIDYVEIYTEKPKNGCWIKKIVFTFPIPTDEGEVREIALESSGMLETVCLLSKLSEAKHHVSVQIDVDELDLTAAESKATYKEIQAWVQEKYGFHVTNLNIA
jgi:site-specific DNA recombinase